MTFNTCQFPHFQGELPLSGFKIEEIAMLSVKRFLKTTVWRKLVIGPIAPIKWGMRNFEKWKMESGW